MLLNQIKTYNVHQKKTMSLDYNFNMIERFKISQNVSLIQWMVAINSTSIVDNAMIGYFLHLHKMTPMPTKNT